MNELASERFSIMPPPFVENVLSYLARWRSRGRQTVLVTLVSYEGSSPRPVGAQMAVSETGTSVGHISTDCLGAAIIEEAKSVEREGRNRLVRYGKGSKYMDIKLPCGSGIDLYFDGSLTGQILDEMLCKQASREPFTLQMEMTTGANEVLAYRKAGDFRKNDQPMVFYKNYLPPLQLFIAGTGPAVTCLAKMAEQANFEITVSTSDNIVSKQLRGSGIRIQPQGLSSHLHMSDIDAFTASVLLFHDHDKEHDVLKELLASESFYIGAMGSSRTHQVRLAAMKEMGFSDAELTRIRAPIGAVPNAKSPVELAVSILAEIMSEARAKNFSC